MYYTNFVFSRKYLDTYFTNYTLIKKYTLNYSNVLNCWISYKATDSIDSFVSFSYEPQNMTFFQRDGKCKSKIDLMKSIKKNYVAPFLELLSLLNRN